MNRLDTLMSWHASWSGLRVGVLGVGVTGFAAADTLNELGASVCVVASQGTEERERLLDVLGVTYVRADLDEGPPKQLIDHDPELLIVSPGFHPDSAVIRWAESTGIPVWGDVELAWRVRDKVRPPSQWILVTGTNGKTTTVQLTAAMLHAGGYRVAPCGNIGVPVLDAVRDPMGFDVCVVELSSYQLHWLNRGTVGDLVPYSSVCVNFADDHLDWHGSEEAYRHAKAKVYANTITACVFNRADPATEQMVREAEVTEGARAVSFGLDTPAVSEFGIVDGIVCDRAFLEDRRNSALEITTVQELGEAGLSAPHIMANVLAASALARSYGVEPATIAQALQTFTLDNHRIEVVATVKNIRWVNDSKATNPHAAEASLRSYDSVVWVVGGLLKGVDVDNLVKTHVSRLRGAIIIGADRQPLRSAFRRHAPHLPVYEVDETETKNVMPSVVEQAARFARDGDTVLLAPAAASMDQFVDYADRGTLFTNAVHKFLGGDADESSATHLAH